MLQPICPAQTVVQAQQQQIEVEHVQVSGPTTATQAAPRHSNFFVKEAQDTAPAVAAFGSITETPRAPANTAAVASKLKVNLLKQFDAMNTLHKPQPELRRRPDEFSDNQLDLNEGQQASSAANCSE